MRYLKLAFWVPVALVILAVMYLAWLGGRATSHEWKWLTMLAACVGVALCVPVLFGPALIGAATVLGLMASGQVILRPGQGGERGGT